jgi:prepilin-type processing-associated H-X9-DG protein
LVLAEAHQAGRGGNFLWLDGKLPFTLFTLASFVSCLPYQIYFSGGLG